MKYNEIIMMYMIGIVFLFATMQSLVSTLLSLGLALPLGHFFYRFDFSLKRFFISLCSMLCIMPTKLIVLCITLFYGATGFTGIILAHLMLNVPFSLYILHATYEKIDATLLWLAADSGANQWQCYRDIIFPLLRPTIISVFLLLFLLHVSSFSIPLLMGSQWYHQTPEIMLYTFYSEGNNWQALLSWIVRLMIILPLFLVHNRHTVQKAKIGSLPQSIFKTVYRPFLHSIWWLIYGVLVAIVIIGPLGVLLFRACDIKIVAFLQSIFSFLVDADLGISVHRVILNSLFLAIVSGIGAVLLAFILGVLECRMSQKNGVSIISFISIMSLIIGSVGCGILFSLLSYGKIVSSFFVAVLCHIFLNYAFAYRIIRAQLVLYHPDLHKTAQACGATLQKAVKTITWPFILPALYRAFCISFGLSLTEVGAGTVLQGKIGLTIPMAIRIYRKSGNQDAVIGLSLILLGLVFLVTYCFVGKRKLH